MRNSRSLIMISAVAAMILPACSDAGQAGAPVAVGGAELPMDVRVADKLIDDLYAAWNTLDAAKAKPFYTDDPDAVFIDVAPPAMGYSGRDGFMRAMQVDIMAGLSSLDLRRTGHAIVERRGSVAWAVFPFSVTVVTKKGERSFSEGRHTIVWENKGGRWIVAHEHPSVPASGG